ncbi:hypothetical protein RUM44_001784 [Polyplax serrata]|uniref:Clip domain-containing protein n=1 Tax=Polyplax serrata TaxID=468196 RepID=A0ABR1AL25_POLSC
MELYFIVIVAVVALSWNYTVGQGGFFRDELYPEQIQQHDLQIETQKLQDQLQEMTITWQNNPGTLTNQEYTRRRGELLKKLQENQNRMQELQDLLQLRLTNSLTQFLIQNNSKEVKEPEKLPTTQITTPTTTTTTTTLPTTKIIQQQLTTTESQIFPFPPLPLPQQPFFTSSSSSASSSFGSSASSSASASSSSFVQHQPQFLAEAPPCRTQSGENGRCRPLSQCVNFYAEVPELRRQPCQLNNVEFGVCCPLRKPIVPVGGNSGVLHAPPPPPVVVPPFTPLELNNAGNSALQKLHERLQFISQLFTNHVFIPTGTPAAHHLQFFKTSNDTLAEGDVAQKTVEASVNLVNDFQLSPDQGRFALPTFSVLNTVIADTCPRITNCRVQKYRTPDGSCNNLSHDRWGKSGTALQRIIPPKYEDGVNAPRNRAENGQELPSARLVSTVFATDANIPHENLTQMVMQWGQFLDHDLTHTPITRGQGGSGITCCQDGVTIAPNLRHPDCFPIALSRNDHIFAPFGERCMEFVRSLPAPRPECNFGPREQMNQITGYLDGSNIYGSNLGAQRELREFKGGRLRIQNVQGRQYLPDNEDECANEIGQTCFKSGDSRVNEQVNLALMHTIWMREHNRIAAELQKMHPNWSDEALFQEARRIVIAEMQHITYNEFLPILLGREYMEKFELTPKEEGQPTLYNEGINPSITNVFATAAFRFGHSLVGGIMQGLNRFGSIQENLVLHQNHFSPFALYKEEAVDDFIRGLTSTPSQKFDRHFSSELTDHLFQGDLDFGLDLVALNIQRGRDHGIAPYNEWREVCSMPKIRSWEELTKVMDPKSVNVLRKLYPSVNDLDLFIAAVSEHPVPGALLSPTFVCLVGDQFARLRRGDRFFYEEGNQPSSFTLEQLNQIRKSNLARILCDNSDNIVLMQPLAFFKPSLVNQRVDCRSESILRVDLDAWRNEQPQA